MAYIEHKSRHCSIFTGGQHAALFGFVVDVGADFGTGGGRWADTGFSGWIDGAGSDGDAATVGLTDH